MAWTAPMTFTAGTTLTAAQLNTFLRDNSNETAPAKATTAGGYFIATDVNSIVERIPKSSHVDASESTSSSSYTDLATVGPQVTVTTGARALVFMNCGITVGGSAATRASFEISGASSVSADDNWSLRLSTSSGSNNMGNHWYFDDLTPGVNVFTMKYLSGSGSASFFDRKLTVFPWLPSVRAARIR